MKLTEVLTKLRKTGNFHSLIENEQFFIKSKKLPRWNITIDHPLIISGAYNRCVHEGFTKSELRRTISISKLSGCIVHNDGKWVKSDDSIIRHFLMENL